MQSSQNTRVFSRAPVKIGIDVFLEIVLVLNVAWGIAAGILNSAEYLQSAKYFHGLVYAFALALSIGACVGQGFAVRHAYRNRYTIITIREFVGKLFGGFVAGAIFFAIIWLPSLLPQGVQIGLAIALAVPLIAFFLLSVFAIITEIVYRVRWR